MVKNNSYMFYSFNDQYFITLIHRLNYEGFFDKEDRIKEIVECLLFEKSPRTIRCEEFKQRILNQDEMDKNEKFYKKAIEKAQTIQTFLEKEGSAKDWIVVDIPKKNIVFTKSKKKIIKENESPNVLLERDPTKILTDTGEVRLLVDVENSIIAQIQSAYNFVPNVFCSESAYQLLKAHKMTE